MKHQILEHVKKVCGLKHSNDIYGIFDLPVHLEHLLFALEQDFNLCDECKGVGAKIIGEAGVSECNSCGGDGHGYGDIEIVEGVYTAGMKYKDFRDTILDMIDLSKSVEQNLEDPQVCEVISKLLKLK